jgi:RNA recognition motif-containing protein
VITPAPSCFQPRADKEDAIATKIFVGNLSYGTTREELAAALAPAGNIVGVVLPTDRETGRPRGFAFVEFASEAEAAEAVRLFNQFELGGRKLTINAADARPRRSDGPPPFRSPGPPQDGPPFGGGARPFDRKGGFKRKGSRRGLRGRKRSL